MPVYSVQEVAENATFKPRLPNPIVQKEIKDGQTGQKMSLTFVNMLMELNGKVQSPMIQFPKLKFPRGVTKEEWKLKGLTIFDWEDEETRKIVTTTRRTQKTGCIKKSDVSLESDIGTTKAKSNDGELSVYDSPNGEVKFTVSEDEELIVIGKKEKGAWLVVKTEGTKGYFEMILEKISEVLFEMKDKLPISHVETVEDVIKMMKNPVYFPINKETKEYDDERSPSQFSNFFYYKDNATGEEKHCNFTMPIGDGKTKELHFAELENQGFEGRPLMSIARVLVGKDRINTQFNFRSVVITDILKREQRSLQEDIIAEASLSIDEEKVKANLALLESNKKNTSPARSGGGGTAPPPNRSPPRENTDIDDLLNGVGNDDVDLELPDSGDTNPEVPGLDD